MFKRVFVMLLLLTVSVAAYVALVEREKQLDIQRRQKQFDTQRWRETKFTGYERGFDIDHEYTLRYLMVDELTTKKLSLETVDRNYTRELLGDPEIDDGSPRSISSGRYDAYIIRYHYSMCDYDTEYLILKFDADDNLISTERRTDPG